MSVSLEDMLEWSDSLGSPPTFAEMPRRTLADKGIDGPTAVHLIEEVHVPPNLAYITFTTGSSAFQNIVGVTHSELPGRIKASRLALDRIGLHEGDLVLIAYPPLVNVFTKKALDSHGLGWSFLERSTREALISGIIQQRPKAVVGESSFLRASLEDILRLGFINSIPKGLFVIAAGTPLDPELILVAERFPGMVVHDLYGCQEMGWIALNGSIIRDDVVLMPHGGLGKGAFHEVIVGGIPVGDAFPLFNGGHPCDASGGLITCAGKRAHFGFETVIRETTMQSAETASRVARTILRIKGRIVRVSSDLVVGAPRTLLEIVPSFEPSSRDKFFIEGPGKTGFFDDMAAAQLAYQSGAKNDPSWTKRL